MVFPGATAAGWKVGVWVSGEQRWVDQRKAEKDQKRCGGHSPHRIYSLRPFSRYEQNTVAGVGQSASLEQTPTSISRSAP
jgi:hypothetical protein